MRGAINEVKVFKYVQDSVKGMMVEKVTLFSLYLITILAIDF